MKDWSRRHVLRATAGPRSPCRWPRWAADWPPQRNPQAPPPAQVRSSRPARHRRSRAGDVLHPRRPARRGVDPARHRRGHRAPIASSSIASCTPPVRHRLAESLRNQPCRPIARRRRSPRIRSPTTPTPTPSSAPTTRTPSRSSATTSRSRTRPAARTSSSSATTCCTGSTSTTPATARADIVYEFRFTTTIRNPNTFLYNTGPIASLTSPNFNRPQTYTVTEVRGNRRRQLGNEPADPAVQHRATVHTELPGAGQRGDQPGRATASRCSPGSGSTASTSTSARCSTSPSCGRSRTCT